MTDKVQKIREEVERLQYELIKEKEKGYGSNIDDTCILELQNILTYIDSMQEEPNISPVFDEGYWERLGEGPVSKEIGNYDHKAIMESLHPELKEEPVNEELEKAADIYGDELDNVLVVCNDNDDDNTVGEYAKEAFKVGAKWQKERMMAKAIDAHCFGFQGAALFSFRLPADNYLVGSEVKVIVIKKD